MRSSTSSGSGIPRPPGSESDTAVPAPGELAPSPAPSRTPSLMTPRAREQCSSLAAPVASTTPRICGSGTATPGSGLWIGRPRRLPASWPPSLLEHTLVYDSVRARMVVLGGRPFGDGTLDSVWEWDGATGAWTEHAPIPLMQDWPLPRWGAAAAYDSERHCVVMVGGAAVLVSDDAGQGDLYTRQTWEWHGDTGTFIDRTVPARWPTKRVAYAFTFDTDRGKAIVVNGATASGLFRELWEWDGAGGAWTDRTPSILPPAFPGLRSAFPIAYDQHRGLVVTFGARSYQDLHEWNPATGVWTNRTPNPIPASWPNGGAMVYDAKRKPARRWSGGLRRARRRIGRARARRHQGARPANDGLAGGDDRRRTARARRFRPRVRQPPRVGRAVRRNAPQRRHAFSGPVGVGRWRARGGSTARRHRCPPSGRRCVPRTRSPTAPRGVASSCSAASARSTSAPPRTPGSGTA